MANKIDPYFEKYLDQKFGEVNQNIKDIKEALVSCETRVTCLESWKAEFMGKVAIIGVFLTFVMSLAVDWVREKLNLK
jgi:hypothetical protein